MEFEQYLSALPEFEFAITYGSGVFRQNGYSDQEHQNAMLDVIIGVENPEQWHFVNMAKNPKHYSIIRHLGPSAVCNVQDMGNGHVYYNRHVMGTKGCERPVKYGVISLSELKHDLLTWNSLYVAGRLQKPVRVLRGSESVIAAMNQNLEHAIISVLPLLPSHFTDHQLFLAIAGLSYNGDIRTWFAENQNKVQNIVDGNYERFKELYKKAITGCQFIHAVDGKEGMYCQDVGTKTLARIITSLPSSLHPYIRQNLQFSSFSGDVTSIPSGELYDIYHRRLTSLYDQEGTNQRIVDSKDAVAKGITTGVRNIVFRSSVHQAMRGGVSFGLVNSVSYVAKKIVKFIK